MKFSRILPLVASISTIALVAACARHEKSPKISKETMELQAVKTLRDTYGNVDIYDPSSIALAKQIDGADLLLVNEVNKDDKAGSRDVEVDIHVLMKDRANEMVAHGVISHQGLSTLVFKTDEKEYSMTAKCHAKDCANIVVELTKMKAKPALAASKAADASGVGSAATDVEQQAELRTAPADSTQAGNAPSDAVDQAAAQASAPAEQVPQVATAAASLVLTPDAKAYLQFRVPLRDVKAKESLTARTQRQATFNLFWSSPTQKGDSVSGTTKTVSLAMKDRGGKQPTAPAVEGETNTQDQSNENTADAEVVVDKGGTPSTGTQAPTKAADKPAVISGQAAPTTGAAAAPKATDGTAAPAPAKPGATAANPTAAVPQVQAPAPTRVAAAPSTGAATQVPQTATRGAAAPAAQATAAPKTQTSGPDIVVTATHASMAKAFTDGAKELEAKAAKEKDATKKAKLLADAKAMRTKAAASQAKADAEKKANEQKGAATMAAAHTAGSD